MVTQRVEQTCQDGRALSPWKAVGIFLAFTICLDAPFWVIVNATQTINATYIFGMMWMPAIAAFLTCRVLGRPLRSLGLGTWNGRFVLLTYLIPIAYCLVASLGTWLFGFGGFPNVEFVRQTAASFGVGGAPDWVLIAMFVVLTGTTGMIAGVATAAGEEIGWRGFLQSIFFPLTTENDKTKWVAGDLGLAFVVVAAVVAVVFWAKRGALKACG